MNQPSPPTGRTTAAARSPLSAVGALVALAVSAFAYVTTENLPIGLLQVIAEDLRVSLPAVGLLVTGYGVTVAIVSVPLTHWTRRIPRRHLISGLLAVFVLATVVSVSTSSYTVLLAARVITALSQAVFWSVAGITAAGLFRPEVRGRVISVLFAGSSLGIVAGVPAGTWLGQQSGWRAAFLALSALGALTFVAVIVLLPTEPPGQGHAATGTTPDARRYWIVVVTTGLIILGQFTCHTYITTFLTDVSGFSAAAISPLLLLSGLTGIAGTAGFGFLVDRAPRTAMVIPVALLTVTLLGLYAAGAARLPAAALMALSGFSMGALVTALQSRTLQVAPGRSEIAAAGTSASFNVGISGGALIGGVLLPHTEPRAIPLAGAAIAACALVVLLCEPLVARRPAGPGAREVPDQAGAALS
ncbi:MFS transporter [Actinomadura alba]|uniref:MFS transporter n=1 Tax=Actinomadura alba TaxID=406431 RepID=A0ABR7LYM2_9ACTN|nr:MFS transporter [Actinomadura alba]MBC6469649.1 MFS transporter [Actinomadura alba]